MVAAPRGFLMLHHRLLHLHRLRILTIRLLVWMIDLLVELLDSFTYLLHVLRLIYGHVNTGLTNGRSTLFDLLGSSLLHMLLWLKGVCSLGCWSCLFDRSRWCCCSLIFALFDVSRDMDGGLSVRLVQDFRGFQLLHF